MRNTQNDIRDTQMLKEFDIKVVKKETQYRAYLEEIERLAASDPDPEMPEGARLELLAKLVEDYEKQRYVFHRPDPIDAVRFRMEEQGLRQKDIADLLGGKNRASEILTQKRPLTLPMIRALHERLGIPADLLIGELYPAARADYDIEPQNIPYQTLVQRGWIARDVTPAEVLKRYLAPVGSPVFLRHTLTFGITPKTNLTHLWLWLARVRELAEVNTSKLGKFSRDSLGMDLLKYVARLSWMEKGPRLAIDFLAERGITVVIEQKLPGTRVDGAALIGSIGAPIVAITVQHDRLDNFWFTLLHELAHAWKHLDARTHRAIIDEEVEQAKDTEAKEREANEIANEALLPRATWRRSDAFRNPTSGNIKALAAEQQIHPAIVAGRVRFERHNYALFSALVGHRQVRPFFPEIRWD